MLLQICGRGTKNPPARRELLRNEAGIVEFGDTDRDVDAFADDIQDMIGRDNLDTKIGILFEKATEIGGDMQPAKSSGNRYLQRSASTLMA